MFSVSWLGFSGDRRCDKGNAAKQSKTRQQYKTIAHFFWGTAVAEIGDSSGVIPTSRDYNLTRHIKARFAKMTSAFPKIFCAS